MSKSQERRKTQGNMSPQKVNNHTTKDLMDSKGNENSISDVKRIVVRIIRV
jgi:hypothetical protein